MSVSIRVGDVVEIVRGTRNRNPDKAATRGRVLSVDRVGGRVVVEGVNLRTHHLKKSQKYPQGGRLRREAPVAISNVMLVTDDGKAMRLANLRRSDGKIVAKEPSGSSKSESE